MSEPTSPSTTHPTYDERGRDPRAASDAARPGGPVQRTAAGEWVVLGHDEAAAVARDAGTFSSAVSRFLQVPNGLDGAEHAAFRAALDGFFSPEEMERAEPDLRGIARDLSAEIVARAGDGPDGPVDAVDAVGDIGAVLAVRAQCRWLGWPAELEPRLLAWMDANHAASRDGSLDRTAAVAAEFDEIIASVVDPRRGGAAPGEVADDVPDDVTTRLLLRRVSPPDAPQGRPLTEAEVVSVLRNWTGGDLGSIALCVGVLLTALAGLPEVQDRIRAGMERRDLAALVDELLRIDDPFVSNRRVATCPASIGGADIAAGDRVRLHWTSVNRDERTFAEPSALDPAGHADANLVWGTGPHVCPGRPLATLELCIAVEELLRVAELRPAHGADAEREIAPVGGYAVAPVTVVPLDRARAR